MKELSVRDLQLNPFTAFGEEWFALAAGHAPGESNAMTIAWGHLGALWERGSHANRLPTAIVYVRPSRYTKEIIDREPLFSLSLLDATHRKALGYLGGHSGRDGDKFAPAGLTPLYLHDTVCFEGAKLTLICRKLYHAPLVEEGFVDRELVDFNYPKRDFHELYVGEVLHVMEADTQA